MYSHKITFGFSTRPGNLLSTTIRTVEGTDFSHCFLVLRMIDVQRDVLFEATIPYVTITNRAIFYAANSVIETIDIYITDAEYASIMQFFLDNTGKRYATKKLLGILWKRLMRQWGRNIKNPAADGDKTEECSEVAALVLKILGLQTNEDLESVGPKWVRDQAAAMAAQRANAA